jgi:hypothetical protein
MYRFTYINQKTHTKMNTLHLFEASYQFDTITTELNITPDFIQFKLAKQHEYRPSKESLWAELNKNGQIRRYKLDYANNQLIKL